MFKVDDLKVRRKSWVKAAHIPPARLGWTLEDCDSVPAELIELVNVWMDSVKNKEVIRSIGSSRCGKGILLWGDPGHGKTTLALSIIQQMMTEFPLDAFDVKTDDVVIRPCYFVTYNDILRVMGALMDDPEDEQSRILYDGILGECPNDAYNIRVLIIDDIGKEHRTDSGWQKNTLHDVLRTRFNNGLPTIVTTNLERSKWAGIYGDATGSFIHESLLYIPMNTTDLRKNRK